MPIHWISPPILDDLFGRHRTGFSLRYQSLYKKFVYICICSVFYSIILLLLWCDYGQGDGFACMYLPLNKALTHEYVPHL